MTQAKEYRIFLDGTVIGITKLEKADPPMGVAFGEIKFLNSKFNYSWFKSYCNNNHIKLSGDDPEQKVIITNHILNLEIVNSTGVKIEGLASTIEGMDEEGFDISIVGIAYPFYAEEFPHHVKLYKSSF